MPKKFNSIEEKREYERTRKQIQKENKGINNEKKNYIVYSVHLKENCECCYVGMTHDLDQRIEKHKTTSKRENNFFYDYVKEKGGWDNFHFVVVTRKETISKDILIYENYFIRYLNPAYNSVRPYISNAEYNRIAIEMEHSLLLPVTEIKNFSYRKINVPKFVGLNPILDEEETRFYVVYKIQCMMEKSYVGQTYDTVQRFADHKENSKSTGINILYDHIYSCGGWENSKITYLYKGIVPKKRILLIEAYFIKKLKPELNALFPYISQTDFDFYHKYFQLQ